jgi:uroporphyrinogen-III decarboxylase
VRAAKRYCSPLAIPLMDLSLEKDALLVLLGIPAAAREKFHFEEAGDASFVDTVASAPFMTPRMEASCEAIRYVAEQEDRDLHPLGMCIGPFSLMTKLLRDPITPVFMAGTGLTAEDDEDVERLEWVMKISTQIILRYVAAQLNAGAKGMIVCEPAANRVYFSPNQLAEGSDVFNRFVMEPNLRIKTTLDEADADLIFHNCGELTDGMVRSFNRLHPVMLSLGCSRKLWEDAALVDKDIVLYGNLPSKKFYSDEAICVVDIETMTRDLIGEMKKAGHPFIMGTECDVLSVPGRVETIHRKIDAMMNA